MTIKITPVTTATSPPSRCLNCRLRRTDAFTPASADTIDFIERFRSGSIRADAGAIVVHEQQANGKLFTLYSGWAFRYKSLSDGRRQILNFLLPGDLVGLQQEFSDTALHGVEAVTDVSLCVFPQDGLWELFRKQPELGYDITWLTARGEGFVDDYLLTTGRRNATERIAMLLMHLYRRLQRLGLEEKDPNGQGGTVAWPINQQHIADALGLSLVHTNKTLRRLLRLGLHDIQNGRLRLLNPKALERIADYYETPRRRVPLL